jgi:2-oxoglutarate dehydrogenase complex dehydrogenase (E1) component-like enzyme
MRDAQRIPLVVMTPKSMLRHPRMASHPRLLTNGTFELVIDDPYIENKAEVRRLLLCCGKVYYDLLLERERRKISDIAIIRVEQLYPYPDWNISQALENYPRSAEAAWVQEEPQNMGGWNFVRPRLQESASFGREFRYVGRVACSSSSTGSLKTHRMEQAAVLNTAFEP